MIHKENGGVSRARNTGLKVATGELVMFVDSDDSLALDAVESLVQLREQHHTELTCGSLRFIKTGNRQQDRLSPDAVLIGQEYLDNIPFIIREINPGPCMKLYEMQIIRENALRFPEDIPYGEDTVFLFGYLSSIRSLCMSSRVIYFYSLLVPTSSSRTYHNQMHQYLRGMLNVQLAFLHLGGEEMYQKFQPELEEQFFQRALCYYVLHEKNQTILNQRLRETVDQFPEATQGHYGQEIQEGQWCRVARKWKRENLQYYFKESLKRWYTLLRRQWKYT